MNNLIKIINEEINNFNISLIIKQLSNEYITQNKCSLWDINNGKCEEFTMNIIKKLGGYSNNLYELTGDMFFAYRDPKFAKKNWKDVIETKYGVWSKKMLEFYGYPSVDLKKVNDEINHVWIYYNGKHYDAELPDGSLKWYDLPLIKTFFNKF